MLPHHAGARESLYSAEYFRLVRRALKNDGLVLQWIGSHTREEYLLQLRTFLSVCSETTLWGDGSLMVGTKRPFTLSRATHDAKLADPGTRWRSNASRSRASIGCHRSIHRGAGRAAQAGRAAGRS